MRVVTVCALAAMLLTYASAAPAFVEQFEAFKQKYNRKYASASEEARRFKNFADNMRKARQWQMLNPLAKFGVNEFADMSAQEFKTYHNAEKAYAAAKRVDLPTMHFTEAARLAAAGGKQDWRPKGAVTPVKNQGQCGSCWSFSTTGGIEGQWFLAGNTLTSLSEQELVSCDTIDSGCNGGLMDNAFTWLLQTHNGSIVTEASYPYVSGTGSVPACSMTGTQFGAQISSFNNVAVADMEAFVLANGPLSIAVYAEPWQSYISGILTNCPAEQIDHGVLIVGFDDTNTPPYWIIKNSWGPSWGENGYIRVEKGTNQCLITSNPCTSEVKQAGPTPPPSPPPSPSGQTFTQLTCIDNKCQQCSEMTFDQNSCITTSSGSVIASCITDGLVVQAFPTRNCSGTPVVTVNPINMCSVVFRKTGDERFVQNVCPAAPTPTTPSPAGPTPAPTGPTPAPAPTPAPTFPSGWVDLFPPPYSQAPTIMMAISIIDKATSYVPGGENGAGFTVFEFNNQENGVFTPMQMPDMALMILGIAVGGTAADPKGVVGGIGIGNGVQYFANSTTVLPSTVPGLLVQTQDIRMTKDGKNALVIDGISNSALFSTDSGKTFDQKIITNPMPAGNCTGARYGALLNTNVAYISLGNWPCNSNGNTQSSDSIKLTEAMSVSRCPKTGKVKRSMRMPKKSGALGSGSSSGSGNCGCTTYSAAIAKTTDAGNTWDLQVSLSTNFYFNGIDCISETHCVAVGEGFDEGAGGHIWLTTDGKTWKQVFFAASGAQGQYSFMSIRFVSEKEAWVGGSLMVSQTSAQGVFYHTADGGKTWKEYPHGLPNLGAVSSIDFLPNGVGVATAMTIFDDSTVLRYDPNGPPPPGYFIQSQCATATCNELCQNVSFPEDTCLQLNNGGSASAHCEPNALVQLVYQTTDCTGSYNTTTMPLNQCLADNGSYFENYCPKNQQHARKNLVSHRNKRLLGHRH